MKLTLMKPKIMKPSLHVFAQNKYCLVDYLESPVFNLCAFDFKLAIKF